MTLINRRTCVGLLAAPLLLRIPKAQSPDVGPLPTGNWGLDELQWCADIIDQKNNDQVMTLRCNHATRRHIISKLDHVRQVYRLYKHKIQPTGEFHCGDMVVSIDISAPNNIVYMLGNSGVSYTCNLLVPSVQTGPYTNGYPAFYHRRGELYG